MRLMKSWQKKLRVVWSDVVFYGAILVREGARTFLASMRLVWMLKRTSEAYTAVDREQDMHNENMTYLRVRLDNCRKDLFKAQQELRILRERQT